MRGTQNNGIAMGWLCGLCLCLSASPGLAQDRGHPAASSADQGTDTPPRLATESSAAAGDPQIEPGRRSYRVLVGVERLFGVAAYHHTQRINTEFGNFKTRDRGIQGYIFGVNPARGDGADGINLSSYPRLTLDVRWRSGFQVGLAGGAVISTGERRVSSDGAVQDPYTYAVRFSFVLQPRLGQLFRFGKKWATGVITGPQFGYLRNSGDGAFEREVIWQWGVALPLFFSPHPALQLGAQLGADIAIAGRLKQSLMVTGVPDNPQYGTVRQHSLGLSFSGAWVF